MKSFLGAGSINNLRGILEQNTSKKIFLVTGKNSYEKLIKKFIEPQIENYDYIRFYDFETNPKLSDIKKGSKLFKENNYDMVIAVGGGSVIDVAKSISIFSVNSGAPIDYIMKKDQLENKRFPLIAIPTTAGSGSEATHFTVIYVDGIKYSLAHESIRPTYSIVDPKLMMSMPRKVAASSGIDALSHAIESYWSINSTEESKNYSEQAIKLILENIIDSVNHPSLETRGAMAEAAHLAGKAINITKTTAPHAISYLFTSKFGVPHGHAVALTLGEIIKYTAGVTEDDCNDKRGVEYITKTIKDLYVMLGVSTPEEAKDFIINLMKNIGLETNLNAMGINKEVVEKIVNDANIERLSNNPIKLTKLKLNS